MNRLRETLGMIAFQHSIFSLPFALSGAWLAAGGVPPWRTVGLVALAAVAARTAAMTLNRLVDQPFDAANPRTEDRSLPAGRLSRRFAVLFALGAAVAFVGTAWTLSPWCGRASVPLLAWLCAYSWAKRFTWAAHLWLGSCLGLAAPAAWIAVRGEPGAEMLPTLWMCGGVILWVTGFDLIYSSQDAQADRDQGLHSVPGRFGVRAALMASRVLHVLAFLALAQALRSAGAGIWAAVGLAVMGLLLVWQHVLVRGADLTRVNRAFFTANGWAGVAFFTGLAIGMGGAP